MDNVSSWLVARFAIVAKEIQSNPKYAELWYVWKSHYYGKNSWQTNSSSRNMRRWERTPLPTKTIAEIVWLYGGFTYDEQTEWFRVTLYISGIKIAATAGYRSKDI